VRSGNLSGQKTIAVIGAGITGLSAAYYLQQAIRERKLPYDVKLLEASGRLGGKITTEKQNGYIIERGPDSFLARKELGVRLVKQLGLENQLIRNQTGQAYILIRDSLHEIPKGFSMGIPTSLASLKEASILSEEGKKRAAEERTIPPSSTEEDQPLGHFLRHRFGDELVEHVIEPLLSGIYSGDIDQMSLHATFPQFLELEKQNGSLIKGLEKTQAQRGNQSEKRQGQFYTLQGGLDTLVRRLAEAIGEDAVYLNQKVKEISLADRKYKIETGETVVEADAIIMATPHYVLPQVFPGHDFFRMFDEVPSMSVANVALAFDESAVDQKQDGTGFVVSRNSDFRMTACTWTHRKWPHTAPEGKALFRAYVGKPGDQVVVDLEDDEIIDIVLNDMKKTMGIFQEPEFAVVTRWKEAMPQYTAGHKKRVDNVRAQLTSSLPGLFLAGSSYEGVGIPDCIGQGERAANDSLKYLAE
jgi:oxygen-dependent protoporphyrinogen oxidase